MAFVVTQPCHDCKYTDCVTVCPMECFYQDESMLYIDPQDCIDCDACAPECPVEAIFQDSNVPARWVHYVTLNAERTAALRSEGKGRITERQDPKKGPGCHAGG
jgi:ferredoxin